MKVTSDQFSQNTNKAIQDKNLQKALLNLKRGFVTKRAAAVNKLPEFQALRDAAKNLKDHTLQHLDHYLEHYEKQVIASGGKVHWARNDEEAKQIVLAICQEVNAKRITKGKSMLTEEIALNDYLAKHGYQILETDLGEYILQIRNEHPTHIVAPAIHLTKEEIADDFHRVHTDLDPQRALDEPKALLEEARQLLRQQFLQADVGITGANFLIAESGTSVIVTNEGNGDLTQNSAKTHIVMAGIEKIVPNFEDAATLIRLLGRSATGQEMSSYTTFSTGPKQSNEENGPEQYHVVLVDNGRSSLLASEFQPMLRCIRCAACMNHCPVYQTVGGKTYGWVYPGPMGSVLTPSLAGIEKTAQLPNASTFCGKCAEVCPVKIPLPDLMRYHRRDAFDKNIGSRRARWAIKLWAAIAKRPRLYHWLTAKTARYADRFVSRGWTAHRDFPKPAKHTFMAQWRQEKKHD